VGRIEDEFAGLMVLGICAFAIDFAVSVVQKRTLAWAKTIGDEK
jgi:ABC-type nitrate/sulfonate/bicarbonate transport system permease component